MVKSNLYFKDVLAETISNRLKWSPIRTAVYVFFWTWLNAIVLAILNDRLLPGADYRSLSVDYYHHVSTLLYAFVWGFFIWLYKAPANVIEELQNSGVITIDAELLEKARGMINRKSTQIIALSVTILASSLNLYQDLNVSPVWLNASPVFLALRYILLIVPTTYVTVTAVVRYIVYAQVFRLVLRDVKLHPLHPDKAGGLRPLGRYALRSTYPIAVAGSVAAVAIYWSIINGEPYTYVYLAAFAYIILAPWMFFAPLSSVHQAMLNAKNDLKTKISRQFNNDYSLAYNEISGSAKQLKDNLEKLEQLQKLHKMADAFPVWPFDIQTMRQFVLTMLSPVFSVLLSIGTNFLNKLLLP